MKPWMKKTGLFIYSTLITSCFGFIGSATLGLGGSYLLRAGVAILLVAGVMSPVTSGIFIATIVFFTLGGLIGAGIGIKWTYPLFKVEKKNSTPPVLESKIQDKPFVHISNPSTVSAGNACTQKIFLATVKSAYIPAIEIQERKNILKF